ncbi:hypothetical protein AVEN_26723-1 [Araneus ventricosus]|uniref:Uncharacterized protein n=1 Tax=Araneus ventricosus TaxID=182803 RepID=A0A4Y2IMP8_ARAVE|nr:hypothetical protein AVEN_26723-1 [Araneus ventricosus]
MSGRPGYCFAALRQCLTVNSSPTIDYWAEIRTPERCFPFAWRMAAMFLLQQKRFRLFIFRGSSTLRIPILSAILWQRLADQESEQPQDFLYVSLNRSEGNGEVILSAKIFCIWLTVDVEWHH